MSVPAVDLFIVCSINFCTFQIGIFNLGFNRFEDKAAEIVGTVLKKIESDLILRAAFMDSKGSWRDPCYQVRHWLGIYLEKSENNVSFVYTRLDETD